MTNDDLERFRALAFLYVCDKLDDTEAAWMRQKLVAHPEWQAELDQERRFAEATREAIDASYAERPPLVAFDELPTLAPERSAPSLGERLRTWWTGPMSRGWAFASIAALAIVAGTQTMRLADTTSTPVDRVNSDTSAMRGGPVSPAPGVPMLQVIFREDTTVAQLRAALADLQLDIVRGPDEDGMVWLAVPTGDAAKALAGLKATGLLSYGEVADDPH
ncbi:hypothetical protein [Pandoraea apista]|uniref:hypothetical protein n=1 Tax=Pandoraea apista TaxID=93218 RepID=UPI000658FBB3|nr:hypothetical protein [Pandoraea apista]ALS66657.1 hypothetical protein AT395_18205 [Pandoraea apista]RRW93559.1 hypothetical protein EGJ54_18955 [Pandoraea apista]RRX02703.1 hypothetical protein EGJ56_13350 [Pandoraea apista]CFB61354.1 hypothetical protein LMG16407_01413 [Pandoraea apista]